MTDKLSFEDALKRIDEIAEDIEHATSKPKGKLTIELRGLCGHHRVVPTAYQLRDVVKEGPIAQRLSQGTEIWKGRYKGGEVSLKILRVPQDEPGVRRIISRFCKEVVLMKQVSHENVLPFYGVSTAISDFCLVSPWYNNGEIMEYLKKKPDTNRYDLASLLGAVNGLRFLHYVRVVHGALRPGHILIDDDGNPRLTMGGHSSIRAIPNTSIAGHVQSALETGVNDNRYMAPETQWPEDHGEDKVMITKESDVYEMAMVIYEVLGEKKPHFDCNDGKIIQKVQAGEVPGRPPGRIHDLAWELLEKCWKMDPAERPQTAELYNTLSNLVTGPQITETVGSPRRQSVTGELPGRLKLQVQVIKFSFDKSKKRQFYVKLRYGNRNHTTSPTNPVGGSGEHTWESAEGWSVETNKQYHGQLVTSEVFQRMGIFKKDKVWATGNFSLFNNVNREAIVKLKALDGTGTAVLNLFVMAV